MDSTRPLVSLLSSLYERSISSPSLASVQEESEVSGFVFQLGTQALALLATVGHQESLRGGSPVKIHSYSPNDLLAGDIQELAMAHGGERLLPFSLLLRESGSDQRPRTVLLRIRRWLADNFSFDYHSRLAFLATLLKHWSDIGGAAGSG